MFDWDFAIELLHNTITLEYNYYSAVHECSVLYLHYVQNPIQVCLKGMKFSVTFH